MLSPKKKYALHARIQSALGPHLGPVYPEAFFNASRGLLVAKDFPKDPFPTRYAAFVTDEGDDLVCRYIHGLN